MTETELKFQVPPAQRSALRRAVATRTAQRTRLQAVYADTADDRLAAAGLALRLRKEGRLWVQTLKGRGDGLMQRLEHEQPLPAQRGEPVLDPARHAGTPVGERLLQLLQADAAEPATLAPLYRTDIQRLHRTVSQGGARIELALDEGWISAGQQRVPVFEIEFELKSGPPAALLALAQRWVQRFGLVWDVRTKSERGFRLARGLVQVPAVRAPAVAWPAPTQAGRGLEKQGDKPKAKSKSKSKSKSKAPTRTKTRHAAPASVVPTPAQAWSALLHSALGQVLPNAAELADGLSDAAVPQVDPATAARARAEHLHQLRVGLRRLRTVLAWCADWGPDAAAAQALQQAWREPFTRLGAARDGDVLTGSLWPAMQAAGAPAWRQPAALPAASSGPAPTNDTDPSDPTALVRAPAFTGLLLRSLALAMPVAEADADAEGDSKAPALPAAAARLLHARWLQLRRQARRFERLPLDEQHRTRRRLKRLRYLVEGLLELPADLGWPRQALKAWHRSVTQALDALGHYNDLCMADEALATRTSAAGAQSGEAGEPAAWFARGWLSVQRPLAMAEAASRLHSLAETPAPWRHPR